MANFTSIQLNGAGEVVDAYSEPRLPLIPTQADHLFRANLTSHSEAS